MKALRIFRRLASSVRSLVSDRHGTPRWAPSRKEAPHARGLTYGGLLLPMDLAFAVHAKSFRNRVTVTLPYTTYISPHLSQG